MACIFILVTWIWLENLAQKAGIIPAGVSFAWDFDNPVFQIRAICFAHMFFYWLDVITPPSGLGKLEKRVEELEQRPTSASTSGLYTSYTPGVSGQRRY